MKKSYFEKTMQSLSSRKEEHIQKLSTLSFDKLNELGCYFFRLYYICKNDGYDEASEVHYFKYLIIDEAIEVKVWNEIKIVEGHKSRLKPLQSVFSDPQPEGWS